LLAVGHETGDDPMSTTEDDNALARVIWEASRRDEGTISGTGAHKIAAAVRAHLEGSTRRADTYNPGLATSIALRQQARIDFDEDYGEDAEFMDAGSAATVVTSLSRLETEGGVGAGDFAECVDVLGAKTHLHPDAIHYPVIDIDHRCHWVPSTTPGHGHLYIDHGMTWTAFLRLLEALAEAGVVEEGYVHACRREGFASVRLPWIKKEPPAIRPPESDPAAPLSTSLAVEP
jgi:hypothetical protein